MKIIGYTYDADVHCPSCAQFRFEGGVSTTAHDEHNIPYDQHDGKGDPITPIFADHEADAPQHCSDCHTFIGGTLTDEGYDYVAYAIASWRNASYASRKCVSDEKILRTWWSEYGPEIEHHAPLYRRPGKYEGELNAARWLHAQEPDDGVDFEECRSADIYVGWYGLYLEPFVVEDNDQRRDFELTWECERFLRTQAGALVHVDSLGFVYVNWFGPFEQADLELAWSEIKTKAARRMVDEG